MELRNLKQHLLEELSKVNDETLLKDLEQVFKKRRRKPSGKSKLSDFAGIWKESEAEEMKHIISEGCEQIHGTPVPSNKPLREKFKATGWSGD